MSRAAIELSRKAVGMIGLPAVLVTAPTAFAQGGELGGGHLPGRDGPPGLPGPDCARAQAGAKNLREARIDNCDFSGVSLYKARPPQGHPRRVEPEGRQVKLAEVSEAVLSSSYMIGTVFEQANLHAVMQDVTLYDPASPTTYTNLKSADLTGVDVENSELRKVQMQGANLTGTQLTDLDMTGANLTGALVTAIQLEGVNLSKANITEANFAGTDLTDITLLQANMEGAEFTADPARGLPAATLTDADLTGVKLRHADLRGAAVEDLTFIPRELQQQLQDQDRVRWAQLGLPSSLKADLSCVNLAGTQLADSWFVGTNLSGANLAGVQGEDFRFNDANLNGVQAQGASMADSKFIGATLNPGAETCGHPTEPADFTGAFLEDVDLEGTKAHGLRASGANLNDAELPV